MKYRANPVEIEAEQFFPRNRPWPVGVRAKDCYCQDLAQDGRTVAQGYRHCPNHPEPVEFYVTTIHGDRATVQPGDYIVPEPDGVHYYPVKPAIFEAKYTRLGREALELREGEEHLALLGYADDRELGIMLHISGIDRLDLARWNNRRSSAFADMCLEHLVRILQALINKYSKHCNSQAAAVKARLIEAMYQLKQAMYTALPGLGITPDDDVLADRAWLIARGYEDSTLGVRMRKGLINISMAHMVISIGASHPLGLPATRGNLIRLEDALCIF